MKRVEILKKRLKDIKTAGIKLPLTKREKEDFMRFLDKYDGTRILSKEEVNRFIALAEKINAGFRNRGLQSIEVFEVR